MSARARVDWTNASCDSVHQIVSGLRGSPASAADPVQFLEFWPSQGPCQKGGPPPLQEGSPLPQSPSPREIFTRRIGGFIRQTVGYRPRGLAWRELGLGPGPGVGLEVGLPGWGQKLPGSGLGGARAQQHMRL